MNRLQIGILSTATILAITAIAFYYEYQRLTKSKDDETKKEE